MTNLPGPTDSSSGPSSLCVDVAMMLRPLVHVANLPLTTTERDLREMFGSLGQIQSAKVVTSRSAGGLAYGFVEYVDVASAERAIRTLDGWLWFGTPIKVSWAKHSMHPDAMAETHDTDRAVAMRSNAANSHLFVGDLSADVDDGLLQSFFSRFASLADVRVMYDPETGKSRGFGFISFRRKSDAEECIATTQGQWLGGRQIRVNWASQKNQSQIAAGPIASIATGLVSSAYPGSTRSPTSSSHNSPAAQPFDRPLPTPTLPRRHTTLASQPRIPSAKATTSLNDTKYNYDQILSEAPATQTSVYVGNISPLTSTQDLSRIFAPFNHGQPLEIRIPPPPGRGYAFVTLASHEQAASAICSLSIQGVFMHSRWLRFGWQKDRQLAPHPMMLAQRSESAPETTLYTMQHQPRPPPPQPQPQPSQPSSSSSSSSSNEFQPF